MRTLHFRWQFALVVVALMMSVVLPADAVRIIRTKAYRFAIFHLASNAKIAVGTDRSATLLDLKIGEHVSIAYDQENGALVAHHIAEAVPHRSRNLSVNPGQVSHHPAKSLVVYEHVTGIVQSVNVQDNTLTIAYKLR